MSLLRVRTVISLPNGDFGLNTAYFSGETGPAATDAAAGMRAFWVALAPGMFAASQAIVQPEVEVINAETGAIFDSHAVSVPLVQGTGTGPALPAVAQGLLRLITDDYKNGRRVRGRWFIPAALEAESDATPATAFRTRLNTAIGVLIADNTHTLSIWSRPTPETAGSQHIVSGGNAWTQWASLRSRRLA